MLTSVVSEFMVWPKKVKGAEGVCRMSTNLSSLSSYCVLVNKNLTMEKNR